MAISMRRAAAPVARSTRRQAVVCSATKGSVVEKVQIAAAAVAAAALLVAPAEAGVVLQQPELKKVFQDDAPAAPVKERPFRVPGSSSAPTPAAKKAEAPKKKDEVAVGDGGLDPRFVALPGAIIFVGGLAFAASKVDDGFNDFINGALIRDSNQGQLGVGYENVIKSTAGGIYGPPERQFGTTKVAAKKKAGGFFGKK